MHPVKVLIGLMVLLVFGALTAHGAEPRLVTTIEGISEYRLDNGLKVLLVPDPSRPTTTINITYLVGSKHEGYGETGMAHLLEHMLFYGTPNHRDIKAEISERGGQANGTTWYERTNYFQVLPSEPENLEWAIRMEADRMVNSTILAEDLASEMTVVRNEFEIGENNPFSVLIQRLMATAYLWHGYGRATIGARSDIENVPIERLQAFYRRYYQPDNAVLILSGSFDAEQALALISEHFGAIPAPDRSGENRLWPTYTREPVQDGERRVTVRRSGTLQMAMIGHHVPAAAHPDFAAIEVLGFLLGDMPSGRLHEFLVETELASAVGAFAMTLREPGLLFSLAQTSGSADLDAVEEQMLAAFDDLLANPPDEAAVRRAVNSLTRNLEMTLNDSGRVGLVLSEWAATGDWRLMFLHRDRLEEVTVDDVIRVAEAYLRRDNRTFGRFIPDSQPQRAEIPEAPDLAELLADYTGREAREEGEAFEPTADNIEVRLVRFQLANGAEVVLMPRQTRGNRVHGRIVMRTGSLDSLTGLAEVPRTTGMMLMRGTANRSRQEIRDRIDELQSMVSVGGATLISASTETRRDRLEPVLELIADLLMNPSFPESELSEMTRQRLDSLDSGRDDPSALASNWLNRHFNTVGPDHPRYVTDFDELEKRIRAVTRDQLAEHHRRFYGFGPGTTISFVGDFDPELLREQLHQLFDDFVPEVEFERIADQHQPAEPVRHIILTPDKANAQLLVRVALEIGEDHPDWPALTMAGHVLGGGFLSSRLSRRIRDQEGLSYSVGGRFRAGSIDPVGRFGASAAFAPENRDAVLAALIEELDRARADGFEQEEFDSARTGLLQNLRLGRSSDGQLTGILNSNLYLERDMHWHEAFEQAIAELSPEQVHEALVRWLDPAELTIVMAGDFDDGE